MKLEPVADLVFDGNLYPRHDIDRHHVRELADAFQADENLPALVACKDTRKLIDGVTRWHALIDLYGDEAKWFVKWEKFANDAQRLLRSIQLNARHGMRLTKYDRAHCLVIAEKLRIPVSDLAAGFGVTKDTFEGSVKERFTGSVNTLKAPASPLKRTIRHMAGQKLTARQQQANEKLSGWPQRFYADQLIELIEADLLNLEEPGLVERLGRLRELLDKALVVAA